MALLLLMGTCCHQQQQWQLTFHMMMQPNVNVHSIINNPYSNTATIRATTLPLPNIVPTETRFDSSNYNYPDHIIIITGPEIIKFVQNRDKASQQLCQSSSTTVLDLKWILVCTSYHSGSIRTIIRWETQSQFDWIIGNNF
jgi:hypothetical protein